MIRSFPSLSSRLAWSLLGLCLAASSAHSQEQRFTAVDALHAEWKRQVPGVRPEEVRPEDRARLELTLRRIGAPGTPPLLPPELERPTPEAWEALAKQAKSPLERFTALFMLNRLRSAHAFEALEGLGAEDAARWPSRLNLENQVAAARINGSPASMGVRDFLDDLVKAGRFDPLHLQAAQLRLVLAGKEKVLLDPLEATPRAVLTMMEAWNRAPLEHRERHPKYRDFLAAPLKNLDVIGLKATPAADPAVKAQAFGEVLPSYGAFEMLMARWMEGLPDPAPAESWPLVQAVLNSLDDVAPTWRWPALQALPRFQVPAAAALARKLSKHKDPRVLWHLLPGLRRLDAPAADLLRERLLFGKDPVARGVAIEDLGRLPSKLKELLKLVHSDTELDPLQALIPALERWHLPPEARRALLLPFLKDADWGKRHEAWKALAKLDPGMGWPSAPPPSERDLAILAEAERLLTREQPPRLRLVFNGGRSVVCRLDSASAPLNVANLLLLAREGAFNGRLVPRVVPDFVVQMGSPYDTMDGGPGYTVRCEDSLASFVPGSVGMALSGKDTGGSQFFITLNATPHLIGRYTRVGELEDPELGLGVLDDLELGARLERVEVLEEAPAEPQTPPKAAPKKSPSKAKGKRKR
ncbi:MAG: peptidylprolyl isomerase [Acidobacteria bacterium]|nr:peptidylprolyl isomerase [Acidobacteriota bacterium]